MTIHLQPDNFLATSLELPRKLGRITSKSEDNRDSGPDYSIIEPCWVVHLDNCMQNIDGTLHVDKERGERKL